MPVFYALENIAHLPSRQVGEIASWLHRSQQAGLSIPKSWIISDDFFRQARQSLSNREPVFADWPQLLWQSTYWQGAAGQQMAQRLQRPLSGLSLGLPLQPLLATIDAPMVRLIPSLWFGENIPTAGFVDMLQAPVCWADAGALELAIRQMWQELLSARSLAYWSHWRNANSTSPQAYPQDFSVAIVVQAVEPLVLSGTLTIRLESTTVQAVQGLPEALTEAYPDTFTDQEFPTDGDQLPWETGYQEQIYQPAEVDSATVPTTDPLESAFVIQATADIISAEVERALLQLATHLRREMTIPLKAIWGMPADASIPRILRGQRWPLVLATAPRLTTQFSPQTLVGRPASPGQAAGPVLVIQAGEPLPASAEHHIVVASEVFPDWIPLLKTAIAVVSEQGGLTCHAAILARELQLPAVVGVENATHHLQTGDTIWLDGDGGVVKPVTTLPSSAPASADFPAVTSFESQTQIWLNLSQPESVERLASLPFAGVGLLRSEWLMMSLVEHLHPYEWVARGQQAVLQERLLAQLRPIVEAFFPRPVRYRSLDIRSHEFASLAGAPPIETNPMLGLRGTFSYQYRPEFFRLELAVLRQLQTEGYGNLQLLLPFVRTVEEMGYCQGIVQTVGLTQEPNFQLWIMAEVPSILFLLPDYVAAGAQGISIGTNDLTQLLLGIDRDQRLFSTHFDEHHPAVQRAIAQLIQQARQLQIPSNLCGVAPAHHPDFIQTLVEQGITGISVDASAVETTLRAVQRAEAQLFNSEAR